MCLADDAIGCEWMLLRLCKFSAILYCKRMLNPKWISANVVSPLSSSSSQFNHKQDLITSHQKNLNNNKKERKESKSVFCHNEVICQAVKFNTIRGTWRSQRRSVIWKKFNWNCSSLEPSLIAQLSHVLAADVWREAAAIAMQIHHWLWARLWRCEPPNVA